MVIIPGCIGQPQQTTQPNQTKQQATTAQQTPAAEQTCTLAVQNVRSWREADGDYVLTGHVVNTGSSTVPKAVVVIRFLDATGNVVKVDNEDFSFIGPGESRYFQEDADDVARIITSYFSLQFVTA